MMNKYFIEDNGGLTSVGLANMKKNNFYLYRAFTHIFKTVKDNIQPIGGPYRPALLTGRLQMSDSETGFNTNDLAGKLKYLTLALSEPLNAAKFKKSFLYLNVLEPMSCGTQVDVEDQWLNFKPTDRCEPAFESKSALDAALICQRDDRTAPLGLNFSKLIESFVQTDKAGRYYLDDCYTTQEEIDMDEAVCSQLTSLKSNTRFKISYFNPYI